MVYCSHRTQERRCDHAGLHTYHPDPRGSRVLSFTPPVSLYRLLADNGVPVDMPCGGRQRCLKCKAVVSGGVSPMSEREAPC